MGTAGLTVLFAPLAVALAEDTELQPDLLVAATRDFTAKELPRAPLLAVEIPSPSSPPLRPHAQARPPRGCRL
jgi:hypothetical protein